MYDVRKRATRSNPDSANRARRRSRRVFVGATLVAALAMGAAACGDDDGAGDDPSGDEDVAGGTDPEETVGATQPSADPASFDTEATVRFGYPIGTSQGLDPHRSSQSMDLTFLGPLYDPLIVEMPDGELVPGLATAWEFDDAGEVLTLSLRDGVTFHDGATFDADVVKQNLERAKTVEGSAIAPLLEVVESVEVVDPLTVELHLSGPAATLPRVLADRPGMMISPDALDDEDLANNPVGTGMFELVEYRPGDRVLYERYDDYWNPDDVHVAGLEIIVQGDGVARFNAIQNAETDITVLEPSQFADAEESDLTTVEFDTTGVDLLLMNRTRSEFGDVRVRQAMNHAVDRAAIAETLFFGYANPTEQFYAETYPSGHVAEMEGRYPYDPDLARELLDEAGLGDGFTFELLIPTGTHFEQVAEVMQAQFAEVGITVDLRVVEPTQVANIFFTDQQGDAALGTYPGRTDPAMTAEIYFTAHVHSNPGAHVLDGLDAAWRAALEPLPDKEREERLHELMEIIVEEAGAVVLVQGQALVATQPNVTGFHWSMRGQPDFRGVAVTAD